MLMPLPPTLLAYPSPSPLPNPLPKELPPSSSSSPSLLLARIRLFLLLGGGTIFSAFGSGDVRGASSAKMSSRCIDFADMKIPSVLEPLNGPEVFSVSAVEPAVAAAANARARPSSFEDEGKDKSSSGAINIGYVCDGRRVSLCFTLNVIHTRREYSQVVDYNLYDLWVGKLLRKKQNLVLKVGAVVSDLQYGGIVFNAFVVWNIGDVFEFFKLLLPWMNGGGERRVKRGELGLLCVVGVEHLLPTPFSRFLEPGLQVTI